MAISDKTRKILWGRSGNRCAICRHRLVIEETDLDTDSVVGDECHIRSGASAGPRHDAGFDTQRIDDLANLLLLCRVHHKMVDDQFETYTTELLHTIRLNHGRWVESKFRETEEVPPIKLRRVPDEIPTKLDLVLSGQQLFALASNCHGSYQQCPEDLSENEIELTGGFLQNLKDWIDIAGDLEPLDRLRATAALSTEIKQLLECRFMIFAARERQVLTGGVGPASNMYFLHIMVARASDSNTASPTSESS